MLPHTSFQLKILECDLSIKHINLLSANICKQRGHDWKKTYIHAESFQQQCVVHAMCRIMQSLHSYVHLFFCVHICLSICVHYLICRLAPFLKTGRSCILRSEIFL